MTKTSIAPDMRPYRESKPAHFLLGGFFLLVLGYALYAGWGLLSGPAIELPAAAASVDEQYFLITGTTKRITELRINGANVPVTEAGAFEEPFLLAPGSNHLVLEARDARGRIARETLDVAYIPDESPAVPIMPATTTVPVSTTTAETEGV